MKREVFMPSIEENRHIWTQYNWNDRGDEWSREWCTTDMLWYSVIFPRIYGLLNVNSILEIAPGHGRCSQYLKDLCNQLILVDLNTICIDACKKRFSKATNIDYYVNNGKDLSFIDSESIDFIFSWDSLVHAELDAIEGYLSEFDRILKPGGRTFIHHSNMKAFHLDGEKDITFAGMRANSVDADYVRTYCQNLKTNCVFQEIFLWNAKIFSDVISVLYKPTPKIETPKYKRIYNPFFRDHSMMTKTVTINYSLLNQNENEADFQHYFTQVIDSLNRLNKERKIYIWGAGLSGRESLHFIYHSLQYNVSGFLDRNSERIGKTTYGFKLFHPDNILLDTNEEPPFIVLSFILGKTDAKKMLEEHNYCEWIDYIDFSEFPKEYRVDVTPSA